ncbi:hypothetical protein [Paenisporosarcina sp. OV554]|uniref:hypothetical protein n=1 Tax=Paenisporosarcina sp. OV554 TaxID=2135694 RepID=UPI000D3C0B2A|nr:hypothetical protein [Paenisporosarcina sp. OV554]PUB09451.1 hypothetical protein C8K15_1303 [Paenisporosarcina sp. OV554]
MNKNNMNPGQRDQNAGLPENYPAKLDIIASAITTFGDALATVAAILALEETVNSDAEDAKNQKNQEKQLMEMQKQIDSLTNQLSQINKKLS